MAKTIMRKVVGYEIAVDGQGEVYLLQLDCGHGARKRLVWKDHEVNPPPTRIKCPVCNRVGESDDAD